MNERHRYRVRFAKTADLRLISHRDLLRLFERMFRRAGLDLKMSAGFHPKPKVSFPSALALGIEGRNEVMEVELATPMPIGSLKTKLEEHAPHGLEILLVTPCGTQEKKAQACTLSYEIRVPAEHNQQLDEAIAQLLAAPQHSILREGSSEPIDARKDLSDLSLDGRLLRFSLRATRERAVRPREILEILGLGQLEQSGVYLSRSQVSLLTNESKNTKEMESS